MSPAHSLPDDYWSHVPCGHPQEPVAKWLRYQWLGTTHDVALCHCGRVLSPEDGHAIEEAPGPVVGCDNCGCYVAVPPLKVMS